MIICSSEINRYISTEIDRSLGHKFMNLDERRKREYSGMNEIEECKYE